MRKPKAPPPPPIRTLAGPITQQKTKVMTNTRIKLTWYAVVAFTGIAIFSILEGMDGVAAASVGGILTVVTGYQGSRAWTKSTAMKNGTEDKP